mgnify:CR=1 FL=1
MNKFQKKIEDVMESIEESNFYKCQTRRDLKKVAKALVETNGTVPDFSKIGRASCRERVS